LKRRPGKTDSSKEFMDGVVNAPPFSAPYQSVMYNNLAFVLLSYVGEAITGKPYMQVIDEAVIKPLGLNRTFIGPTNDSYGVIPGDRDDMLWSIDFGNEAS
jgi:CubicO group peptidase (beta-lactamase class C family)